MEKKTSKEWLELVNLEHSLKILDADGWDRNNYDYSFEEELITLDDFMLRVASSTVMCDHSLFTIDTENFNPQTDN